VLTIKGLPEFERQLDRLASVADVPHRLRATKAGAEVLQEEWKARVPVLEGHYRDSIATVEQGPDTAVGVGPVPGVPPNEQPTLYAAKLEFTNRPALRPAIDAAGRRIGEAMGDEVEVMIDEVV